MEKKLKRAVYSLYAVALVQILTLVHSLYWQIYLMRTYSSADFGLPESTIGFGAMIPGLFWSGGLLAAIYKTAPKLRAEQPWAWVAAIFIFLVTAPSYALPAAVVGLVSLFDVEVRNPFIAALDIQL